MKRRLLFVIGMLILLLVGTGAFVWVITKTELVDNPHFICGYPPLRQIRAGLSQDEVVKILGPPSRDIVKSKTPYNFFQGEYEKDIREGWIYEVKGWNGSIEVYFDQGGKVLRSNCGVG